MSLQLYYFHDPMCSWCWAFRPILTSVLANLPEKLEVRRILGGLAPDTNEAMPLVMQQKIQHIWHKIQQTVPGTAFNFDFWRDCKPRRSSYPACRAVIAAREQAPDAEDAMIMAIQQAYYLQARNPSDDSTLLALAGEIGLDKQQFAFDLHSPVIHQILLTEINFMQTQQIQGFPSLLIQKDNHFSAISIDYEDAGTIIDQIVRLC